MDAKQTSYRGGMPEPPTEYEMGLTNAELIARRAAFEKFAEQAMEEANALQRHKQRLSNEFYARLAGESGAFTAVRDGQTLVCLAPRSLPLQNTNAAIILGPAFSGGSPCVTFYANLRVSREVAKSLARQLDHFAETGCFKKLELE